MLEEVLRHLNNWFLAPGGIHTDSYAVENGALTLPFLADGQYFRVMGSLFNDGLYQYPAAGLTDETFTGTVWALAVPAAVASLAGEIAAWQEKNGGMSGYLEESFGGYSYKRAENPATGQAALWQEVFRSRLNSWRRVRL